MVRALLAHSKTQISLGKTAVRHAHHLEHQIHELTLKNILNNDSTLKNTFNQEMLLNFTLTPSFAKRRLGPAQLKTGPSVRISKPCFMTA